MRETVEEAADAQPPPLAADVRAADAAPGADIVQKKKKAKTIRGAKCKTAVTGAFKTNGRKTEAATKDDKTEAAKAEAAAVEKKKKIDGAVAMLKALPATDYIARVGSMAKSLKIPQGDLRRLVRAAQKADEVAKQAAEDSTAADAAAAASDADAERGFTVSDPPTDETLKSSTEQRAAVFRLVKKLHGEGKTFEESVGALRADATTADWVRKKGERHGQRELKIIWARVCAASDPHVSMPAGYVLTTDGLFFVSEPTEMNPDPEPTRICGSFKILGMPRNEAGREWSIYIEWAGPDGVLHRWAIPKYLAHVHGNEIAEELTKGGLECETDAASHELLKRFVGGVRSAKLLRCVSRTGWLETDSVYAFVLPGGEVIGCAPNTIILQSEKALTQTAAFTCGGTKEGWQTGVAAMAVGNDRLVVSISAAFGAPLLDVTGESSGGLHYVGNSQSGKSTLLQTAASVWGPPTPAGQMRAWHGTANGIEGTAAETSDTLLILDELGRANPREVADIIYMLANESGKQRANRTGGARPRQSWRVLFMSSGEITLAQKLSEIGSDVMAGLEVRFINLPADAGAGMGVFQILHGEADAAGFVERLRQAALANYGWAAKTFLEMLTKDRAEASTELLARLTEIRVAFLNAFLPKGASAQVRSVASRFAVIAAGGELAKAYGIVPWPAGEALRAAGACFTVWLRERGNAAPAEDEKIVTTMRLFLEQHGEARFTDINETPAAPGDTSTNSKPPAPGPRTMNRAGWRHRVEDGNGGEEMEFLILPETWRKEIFKGQRGNKAAEVLEERGFLVRKEKGHRSSALRIPGEGTRRVYIISGSIFAGEDDSQGGNDDGPC